MAFVEERPDVRYHLASANYYQPNPNTDLYSKPKPVSKYKPAPVNKPDPVLYVNKPFSYVNKPEPVPYYPYQPLNLV